MKRLLGLLAMAWVSLYLTSCDSVTGQGDNDDGGGDVIINPPVTTPQLNVAIGVTSQTTYSTTGASITVVVSNEGPGTVKNAKASITWPSSFAYSFGPPEGTSCSGINWCDPGETLEWDIGTIAEGGSRALTFHLEYSTYGTYRGAVSVAANASGATSGGASVQIGNVGDRGGAEMTIGGSTSAAAPGTEITMTASYITSRAVSSARLGVEVPAGMEFVSASSGGALSSGIVVWNLGSLQSGHYGQQTVRLRVATARKPGQTVTVRSELQEGSTSLTTAQATVEVPKGGGLQVTLTPTPQAITDAGNTAVTVRVVNTATVAASEVLILVSQPGSIYSFGPPQGADCSGTNWCDPNEIVQWLVGTMQPGEARNITVNFRPSIISSKYLMPLSASADATSGTGGAAIGTVAIVQ